MWTLKRHFTQERIRISGFGTHSNSLPLCLEPLEQRCLLSTTPTISLAPYLQIPGIEQYSTLIDKVGYDLTALHALSHIIHDMSRETIEPLGDLLRLKG